MPELSTWLPLATEPSRLLVAALAVVAAYAVFTLVGFGSALLASSPLAMVMPVQRVIPLLAVLDCASSVARGWRARKEVAWPPFWRLFPGMLAGQLIGVLVLARLNAAFMAAALGLFVMSQGVKGFLTSRSRPSGPAGHPRLALAYGLFGGVLGGLFGSGGFVYASYLERQLESRAAFRATQAVLIALSTAWRIVLCLSVGLVDAPLIATAILLAPVMLIGVYAGHRIDLRLSRQQLFIVLNCLLVASGAGLLMRALP